ITFANRSASSRWAPAGTTRLTRPSRSASAAFTGSPVNTASMARTFPADRAHRWVPPAPGMLPLFPSGWPNWAVAAATPGSHLGDSLGVEGIADLRPVDPHDPHRAVGLGEHELVRHFSLLRAKSSRGAARRPVPAIGPIGVIGS